MGNRKIRAAVGYDRFQSSPKFLPVVVVVFHTHNNNAGNFKKGPVVCERAFARAVVRKREGDFVMFSFRLGPIANRRRGIVYLSVG